MPTIKIEAEKLADEVTKSSLKTELYQEQLIASAGELSQISELLNGKGYDNLLNQVTNKLETQKKLVAECLILSESMNNYCNDLSIAESSVKFL